MFRSMVLRMAAGGFCGWAVGFFVLAHLPPGTLTAVVLVGAVVLLWWCVRQLRWLRRTERAIDDRLFDIEYESLVEDYWNED